MEVYAGATWPLGGGLSHITAFVRAPELLTVLCFYPEEQIHIPLRVHCIFRHELNTHGAKHYVGICSCVMECLPVCHYVLPSYLLAEDDQNKETKMLIKCFVFC